MLAAAPYISYPTRSPTGSTDMAGEDEFDPGLVLERACDRNAGGTEASDSEERPVRTRRERGFGLQSRRQPAWRDGPWDSGCLTFP